MLTSSAFRIRRQAWKAVDPQLGGPTTITAQKIPNTRKESPKVQLHKSTNDAKSKEYEAVNLAKQAKKVWQKYKLYHDREKITPTKSNRFHYSKKLLGGN